MSVGVIYILTNPSFPQYVKIGYANNLEKRLKDLNRSEAVPYAYRAYATYDVDHRLTDRALHDLIDRLNPDLRTIENVNGKTRTKEFFEMTPEDAYSILEAIAKISGTVECLHRVAPTGEQLEDEKNAEEARETSRRPPFRFSMVGLAPGATLEYVREPSKKVTVVDDRRVQYVDVTTSMSALAKEWLGGGAVQGPQFFSYKGELLTDMRDRMERQA